MINLVAIGIKTLEINLKTKTPCNCCLQIFTFFNEILTQPLIKDIQMFQPSK